MKRSALLFVVAIVFCVGAFGQKSRQADSAQAIATNLPAPVAGVKHVIWVWFENRDIGQITAQTAPFFTNFASANANFTNYFGVEHPSQPNYLDAFSGSNQGITDDAHHSVAATVDNLAKQLSTAKRSWRVFVQDYPGGCSDVD